MTRKILLIVMEVLFPILVPGQQRGHEQRDTVCLSKRENATYIEQNRDDAVYDRLTGYFRSDFNKPKYNRDYDCHHLKKFKRRGLPSNWFGMVYYKGSFYTLIVSDDALPKFQVNDSAVVFYFRSGPQPHPITSFKKISSTQYAISYTSCWKDDHRTILVNVYITDKRTKQAVFEFCDTPEWRMVMVCEEKIRAYPAIVKNVNCLSTGGFDGDNALIPYEEMIKEALKNNVEEYYLHH